MAHAVAGGPPRRLEPGICRDSGQRRRTEIIVLCTDRLAAGPALWPGWRTADCRPAADGRYQQQAKQAEQGQRLPQPTEAGQAAQGGQQRQGDNPQCATQAKPQQQQCAQHPQLVLLDAAQHAFQHRAPRVGRNPKTGQSVSLDGKFVPHFKPGKELQEIAANASLKTSMT